MQTMIRVLAVAALLVAGLSNAACAANAPAWHLMDASGVQALRTRSGITISAGVMLQDTCYEAAIQASPASGVAPEYMVVTRMKPDDVGKMCAMVIVPATVRASFLMTRLPKHVKVQTKSKTLEVPVRTSVR